MLHSVQCSSWTCCCVLSICFPWQTWLKCLARVCTSMAQQLWTGTEREADGGKILRACWGLTQAALDRPAERVLRNWISCLGLPSEVEYQSGHLKRKLLVKPSARMWLCRRKSRITRHWSHRNTTVVLHNFCFSIVWNSSQFQVSFISIPLYTLQISKQWWCNDAYFIKYEAYSNYEVKQLWKDNSVILFIQINSVQVLFLSFASL